MQIKWPCSSQANQYLSQKRENSIYLIFVTTQLNSWILFPFCPNFGGSWEAIRTWSHHFLQRGDEERRNSEQHSVSTLGMSCISSAPLFVGGFKVSVTMNRGIANLCQSKLVTLYLHSLPPLSHCSPFSLSITYSPLSCFLLFLLKGSSILSPLLFSISLKGTKRTVLRMKRAGEKVDKGVNRESKTSWR